MDKNSLFGLFLIGLVIIGYSLWKAPTEEETARKAAIVDSLRSAEEMSPVLKEETRDYIAPAQEEITPVPSDSISLSQAQERNKNRYGIFHPAAQGEDTEYTIENDLLIATISTKGGQMKELQLKNFKAYAGTPLILFDDRSDMSFRFRTTSGELINTRDLYFSPTKGNLFVSEGEEGSFTMRLSTEDPGQYVDLIYGLKGGSYEVDLSINMVGLQNDVDFQRNDLSMHWSMTGIFKEKSLQREKERSSVFYRYVDDEREYLSETSDDETELEAKTSWIAFKQNFFSAVAMHETGFLKDNSYIEIKDLESDSLTKDYLAELTLPVEYAPDPYAKMTFYMGPNKYKILNAYDNEMDRIIDLGWGIFGWMNELLVIPIFNFLNKFISSYGLIILILTIIIKMILFPLTYKNYLSSAKMRVLKPEIEELNKKFENEKDPMKKQQATMALYRKSGVNPMAGCLPMVIQMPILYAMFRFFPASIELRQQPFLWADDLSSYDSIMNLPFEIPFYGSHVSLFTLLMAVSTMLYTRMNSAQMPASQPGMPNMKTMMYIFPVMMLFFFNSFASGLSYYYLLANVFTIGQMIVIKKFIIDEDKLHKKIKSNQKKPKKKSNFQKRLEEAAKQRSNPKR